MRKTIGGLVAVLVVVLAALTVWMLRRPEPTTEAGRFVAPKIELPLTRPSTAGLEITFADATDHAGISVHYQNGATGRLYLPETFGGGTALFDYDGDGWLDIYVVQGSPFPPDGTTGEPNRLYRNNRDGSFADVTEQAGVGDRGYGQGCAVGDYDNDGHADLYVTNYGPDVLYRNNGDGTFTNATAAAGLGHDIASQQLAENHYRDTTTAPGTGEALWGVGCAFGDLDADGDLDLYVATYAHIDLANHEPHRDNAGHLVHAPPTQYRGQRDVLYRNNGDGTFADMTDEAGIRDGDGRGMGVVIADLDQDGRPDIYVANDQTENYYFRGAGPMQFEECGIIQGVARNDNGEEEGSMGVAYGDVNGDGWGDVMVTNFEKETNTIYMGEGKGLFRERTVPMGLGPSTRSKVAWGTQFVDFNNDGRLDLFVANGHVDNIEQDTEVLYAMYPQLFANGEKQFVDVSSNAGPYFQERWVGRGAAFGDIDNDGDADIAATHLPYARSRFTLLRNDTPDGGNVLVVKLIGAPSTGGGSNRDAVGARVTAAVGDQTLMREVIGGGSYLSASDSRIFLGLGDAEQIDALKVHWPSGHVQQWTGVSVTAPGQAWVLVEGGEPAPLDGYDW